MLKSLPLFSIARLKGVLASVAVCLLAFSGLGAWAEDAISPPDLYDHAWQLINQRFVDDGKNQQEWDIWQHRYDAYLKTDADAYVAIDTMIQSLGDRYTRFLPPTEFKEETDSIKATLYGIGVQIGERDGSLVVVSPIEDTPAARAGLKANDVILSVDGHSTQGLSIKAGSDLIKGEKGTAVTLVIKRGETPESTVVIVRDEIKLKAVSSKTPLETPLPEGIAYLKLSSFLSKNAAEELRTAVLKAKEAGSTSLILDLRSNPGGLLENAIQIASLFLENATVVSTVDRYGYKSVRSTQGTRIWSLPLVVLIDEGSASASEILAGALKDHQRATLVGKRSFGKGLVQEINPIPTGAGINVTTQKYLTPNDIDINKKGIEPHVEVGIEEADIKAKKDVQLLKAIEQLQPLATATKAN